MPTIAMSPPTMLLLFVAAVAGGALNAVAGGGSFLSFPSLLVSGVPPVNANATSTVALWPGTAASVGAYRRELGKLSSLIVVWLSAISLIGGLLGAVLLLRTSQAAFARLLPFLMLLATVLFIFGRSLTSRLRPRSLGANAMVSAPNRRTLTGISVIQLVIAIYGGYFGGGIGIMMLAALGLLGLENIHEMNALKTLFAGCINGVAVLTFIGAGAVAWPQAILMIGGALLGGYGCASYARRIDPALVRTFVSLVGVILTVYFFAKPA